MDFNLFWNIAPIAPEYLNRYYATRDLWDRRSSAAQDALFKNAAKMAGKNPYFFVLDFPEPQPTFLRGDEEGPIVQVKYEGRFKLCRPETAEIFHLTVTNEKWKI